MSEVTPNARLLKLLTAPPDQLARIDRILAGETDTAPPPPTGPLLMSVAQGARLLGVSKATMWRMVQRGRLQRLELLPGSYRVRRTDLERIAAGGAKS